MNLIMRIASIALFFSFFIACKNDNKKGTTTGGADAKEVPTKPISDSPENRLDEDMVAVEGGTFTMGDNDKNEDKDEKPAHKVSVSSFKIDKFEVTNAQFAAFMNAYKSEKIKDGQYKDSLMINTHPWGLKKVEDGWMPQTGFERNPVVNVTWFGAGEYAKFYGGRLPTEAEWEFATRGGKSSQNFRYSGSNDIKEVGWFTANSGNKTHPVGELKPNELGIHDMSGNVWEWVTDWYGGYSSAPQIDPLGPKNPMKGEHRVIRGGGLGEYGNESRVAARWGKQPARGHAVVGFRIVKK